MQEDRRTRAGAVRARRLAEAAALSGEEEWEEETRPPQWGIDDNKLNGLTAEQRAAVLNLATMTDPLFQKWYDPPVEQWALIEEAVTMKPALAREVVDRGSGWSLLHNAIKNRAPSRVIRTILSVCPDAAAYKPSDVCTINQLPLETAAETEDVPDGTIRALLDAFPESAKASNFIKLATHGYDSLCEAIKDRVDKARDDDDARIEEEHFGCDDPFSLASLIKKRDCWHKSRALLEFESWVAEQPEHRDELAKRSRQEVLDNLGEELGEGAFGTVYRSTLEGADVAVKILAGGNKGTLSRDFAAEVEVLKRLRHEHVINFIQAFASSSPIEPSILVMQYAAGGSLGSLLYPSGSAAHSIAHSPLRSQPERRATIAMHIASGLMHIHSNGLLHRDLKPANVLLMSDGSAKVSDVGLACIVNPATGSALATTRARGTPLYKAPEQYREQPMSGKVDVFAYGVMLNEIESGMRPWGDMLDDLAVNAPSVVADLELYEKVCSGSRPVKAKEARFHPVIQQCWQPEPTDRPTMREVHAALLKIMQGDGISSSSTMLSEPPARQASGKPASSSGSSISMEPLAPWQEGIGKPADQHALPPLPSLPPLSSLPPLPSLPAIPSLPPLPESDSASEPRKRLRRQ